jgi:PucR C-terminal helix-turn-helix domain
METTRPFEALPPETAEVLRPVLPRLADETIAAIAAEVPDYARAMEGEFGQLVRYGVEVAFNRFVDLIVDPSADLGSAADTYVNLGRGEFHAGRSLDALLAAYRVGARLAWRRFVEAGREGGLPPEVIYDLGEAIFEYIDELSAESAEGYAEAQSAAAGESERRRRRLVRLLAQDPPATQESVRTAAAAAGWPLPPQVAAMVAGMAEPARPEEDPVAPSSPADGGAAPGGVPAARVDSVGPAAPVTPVAGADGTPTGAPAPGEEIVDATAARLARRLGGGAVGAGAGGYAVVVVPDPEAPGRRRQLEAATAEGAAALGPAVPWTDTALSVRRAAAAFRLAAAGRLPGVGAGLVDADDHLAALVLAADPRLAGDLATTRLAPLAELPHSTRERLGETLRAWLDRPGQVRAVAAELDVHPQTVRYRLRQLRELFGDRLDDADARFELSLALRVQESMRYS